MLCIQYMKEQLNIQLQRSITLTNDVQAVPELAAFVDEVCEAIGLDMTTTMQINLALEEAVVNVMNYAYPVGVKGDVTIEAQVIDNHLKLTISDSGKAFDPTARGEVDITLPADERGIGGLGIHLVRHLMDSINYVRENGKNILTLIKKLHK
jgi:sigma-B regulation protein RsbU (phosphoserine phosphatase)